MMHRSICLLHRTTIVHAESVSRTPIHVEKALNGNACFMRIKGKHFPESLQPRRSEQPLTVSRENSGRAENKH